MSDSEIEDIRRIRREISAEHGHDLRRLAEHYRHLEQELRKTGRYRFAEEQPREARVAGTDGAT